MSAFVMIVVGIVCLAYIGTTPGDQYVVGFLGGFLVANGVIMLAAGRRPT